MQMNKYWKIGFSDAVYAQKNWLPSAIADDSIDNVYSIQIELIGKLFICSSILGLIVFLTRLIS